MRYNNRRIAGKFLRKRRLDLGFTQQDVANATGWRHACYISQIEQGITTIGMKRMPKVFEVYQLTDEEKWKLIEWLYPEESKVMKEMACIIAKM